MGRLRIIGAPSSAGAFAPGQELAPAALRQSGLPERLHEAGVEIADGGDGAGFRWSPDPENARAQNLGAVVESARAVAESVEAAAQAGEVALVLGGDCTAELGTVAGMVAAGRCPALVYLDMHPDMNVPESVPDGALDWMGVAHLLGADGALPELARIGATAPLLEPSQVLLLAQDDDQSTPWERELIQKLGVEVIPMAAVAADPEGAASDALERIDESCDALLVHLDVDVIDFTDAPLSENTGRGIGLSFDAALRATAVLLAAPSLAALTVTELNPLHGAEDGSTVARLGERVAAALAAAPALAS